MESAVTEEKKFKSKLTEEEASQKIKSFWKKNGFFNNYISLVEATYKELSEGKCDATFNSMLQKCIAECDKFSLYLVYNDSMKKISTTEFQVEFALEESDQRVMLLSRNGIEIQSYLQVKGQKTAQVRNLVKMTEEKLAVFGCAAKYIAGLPFPKKGEPPVIIRRTTDAVLVDMVAAFFNFDTNIKTSLRMIANGIFTSPDKEQRAGRNDKLHDLFVLLQLLLDEFYSPASDIIHVLKLAYEIAHAKIDRWDDKIPKKNQQPIALEDLKQQLASEKLKDKSSESYWGEKNNVKKDDMVTIVHSGGKQVVNGVLYRGHPGYRLESDMGLGLQVLVFSGKLEWKDVIEKLNVLKYRARTAGSFKNFDSHVTLMANVQAQYIMPASNRNEGGLRPENIGYLQNVKIVPASEYGCFLQHPKQAILRHHQEDSKKIPVPKGFPPFPSFYERIQHMLQKLEKDTRFSDRSPLGW